MTTRPLANDLIAQLRSIAIAASDAPARALPFGVDELDARLAGEGLNGAALHEFAAASPVLADDAAATLFIAGIAARFSICGGPALWALTRFDLYAPGLEQAGLAPGRLVFVEPREDRDVLAVMEDALRTGAVSVVVGEVCRVDMVATRRLQLAAAERSIPALLMRRWRKPDLCPLSDPSAATTRWRIGSAPAQKRGDAGISRPSWSVELVRQRGGAPFTTILEGCDAQGRLALPAVAPDRAIAAGSADARAA